MAWSLYQVIYYTTIHGRLICMIEYRKSPLITYHDYSNHLGILTSYHMLPYIRMYLRNGALIQRRYDSSLVRCSEGIIYKHVNIHIFIYNFSYTLVVDDYFM